MEEATEALTTAASAPETPHETADAKPPKKRGKKRAKKAKANGHALAKKSDKMSSSPDLTAMTNDQLGDYVADHGNKWLVGLIDLKPMLTLLRDRFIHLKTGETVNGFTRMDEWCKEKLGKNIRTVQRLFLEMNKPKLTDGKVKPSPKQDLAITTLVEDHGMDPVTAKVAVMSLPADLDGGDVNSLVDAAREKVKQEPGDAEGVPFVATNDDLPEFDQAVKDAETPKGDGVWQVKPYTRYAVYRDGTLVKNDFITTDGAWAYVKSIAPVEDDAAGGAE